MSADAADIIEESVSLCQLLHDRLSRLRDAVDVRSASPRSEGALNTEEPPAVRSSRSPSQAPAVVQPPTLSTHVAAAHSFSADAARSDASEPLLRAEAQARRRQRPRLLDEASAEAPVTAPEESALYNIDAPPHPLSPLRRRGSISDAAAGVSQRTEQQSPAAMGATRGSTSTLRAEAGSLGRMHAGLTLQHDSDTALYGAASRAAPPMLQPLQQQSAVVLLPAAGGLVAVTSPTSHLQRQLIASPQAHRAETGAQPYVDGPQEILTLPLEPLSPPMRMAVAAADAASSQMDRLDAAVRHAMAVAAAMRAQLGPATAPSHATAHMPAAGAIPSGSSAAGYGAAVPVRPLALGYSGISIPAAAERPLPGRADPAYAAASGAYLGAAPSQVQVRPQRDAVSPARPQALALSLSLLSPPLPARKHAPHAEEAGAAPPPELARSGSAQQPAPASASASAAASAAEGSARSNGASASARSLVSNVSGLGGSSAADSLLFPRQPSQPPLSSSPLTLPGGFAPAAADAPAAGRSATSGAADGFDAASCPRAASASDVRVARGSPPSLSPPSARDRERDGDRLGDTAREAQPSGSVVPVVSGSAPRASAAAPAPPATSAPAAQAASVRRLPRSASSSGAGAGASGGADTLWDSPEAPAQQYARTAAGVGAADGAGAAGTAEYSHGAVSGPAVGAERRGEDSAAPGSVDGDTSAASIGADPSQWLLGPSGGSEQQPLPPHRHGERDGYEAAASAHSQQREDDVAAALERLRRAAAAARAPLAGVGVGVGGGSSAAAAAFAQPAMMASQPPSHWQQQQQPQPPSQASSIYMQPHLLPMLSALALGTESAADSSVRAANEAIMALAAALQRV